VWAFWQVLEQYSLRKSLASQPKSCRQNAFLPFLAACAALQLGTVTALSGTAIAANINRSVEVTIHTFNGGVLLGNLFTNRNFFECHPGDLRLLVERVSSVGGKIEALAVERVWDSVTIVTQSLGETDFANRWKTAFLVDQKELLTARVGDVAAKLHSTSHKEAEKIALTLVAQIGDHAHEDATVEVFLDQILTKSKVSNSAACTALTKDKEDQVGIGVCAADITYGVRGVVQTHVDVIIVDVIVCIGLLVAGILGFLDLWEGVSGWIGENLLLDFVEVGSIIEHVQRVEISVRLEQVIAPSSLRDVRNMMGFATSAKVWQPDRPGQARCAIVVVSNNPESLRVHF